ncbi:MAG: DNA-binding response regulator [Clostridiales bacterium]|jgi:DNA-binding NarL/FixJ family response regulator|uniref:response regulator transcription factor n=1 Tax=Bovifimicola ammoniilytica TaxID=2981720 RepID=UPI00033ADA76|nr:response regulator transcription factor [Bovifimicola ammoniilytica]MBD8941442.1 DNA-binding response regulator [Clostridiales bacterium]MCU6753642.1 response regulator transcription factor [Bovifimicola ammoniilytica]CCZ04057.1 response regulator receiver domain protein [Eubacterium sp. CAG:603]SCJ68559.1 Nitrogen regulation protein C [uncultured Eubacterium sp.]
MSKEFNLVIADDDKLVCQALNLIVNSSDNINVIATGNNGHDAINLYKIHKPDVILMDIRMGEFTGLDAAEEILKSDKNAKILFLTTFADEEYIARALRLGAKGYLLKQNFDSIVPSIIAVMNGQRVFGDEIISKLPDIYSTSIPNFSNYGLTERETEVVTKIAEGLSNKEISDILFLSEGTIRNYISVILEKLNLRDRTQIAIFYYKNT